MVGRWRGRWARALLGMALLSGGCASSTPNYVMPTGLAVSDARFGGVLQSLMNSPMLEGNSVRTLVNGAEIFPDMLESIRGAQRSITFETFVYWSGDVGEQVTDALCERSRAGVAVHLIFDAVGSSRIDKAYVKRMEAAGVEVVVYHRLRWTHLINLASTPSLNYRTHRKLLVVDGRVGYIGGVGIADEWDGDAGDEDHWRDNHYRVDGPAVAQLQSAFLDNWMDSTGKVMTGEAYFPELSTAGELPAQVFMSSPESGGARNMQLMYLLFIAGARDSLLLSTPYFVLDDQSHRALIEAKQRGVDVKILTPRKIDKKIVRQASRAGWGPLLDAGIEIYEFQPTMLHVKLMVVDDLWTSVGSANLDNRSFKLNDEANLNVRDAAFALAQRALFEADLARSGRIDPATFGRRPLHVRMWGGIVSLLRPQL